MKKTKSKSSTPRRLRPLRRGLLRRGAIRRKVPRTRRRDARPPAQERVAGVLDEVPTVVVMISAANTAPDGASLDEDFAAVEALTETVAAVVDPFALDAASDEPQPVAASDVNLDAAVAEIAGVAALADVEIFAPPDLFDAQGNLVVFSPAAAAPEVEAAIAAVESAAPELETAASADGVDLVSVETAGDDVVAERGVLAALAGDDEIAPVDREEMARRLRVVPKLTVVGVLRALVWPLLKLYDLLTWPMHAVWLAFERRRYRRRYSPAEVPVDELVEPTRLVRLWWMTLPSNWPRLLLRFIVVSIVLIFPVQVAVYYQAVGNVRDRMVAQTNAAVAAMRQTQDLLRQERFGEAVAQFAAAEDGLRAVQDRFDRLDVVTKRLINAIPQERQAMALGMSLLSAGQGIARVGHDLGVAAQQLRTGDASSAWGLNLPAVLTELRDSLAFAIPQVAAAQTQLAGADAGALPTETAPAIAAVRTMLPEVESSLRSLQAVADAAHTVLGYGAWQRYLLVFQNSNELRATGGFLGSFALMDVDDGAVARLEVPGGGPYDLEGSSLVRVMAPVPLRMLRATRNGEWQFWDANWWPDYPTSARKLAWFYERSRGPSVDGVIAVTAPFLERVLAVTGPVPMPAYGVTVTAENFIAETQTQVELRYDRTQNRPKQFIADLASVLIPRLTQAGVEQQPALLAALIEGLRTREIQLYSSHPSVQTLISQLGYSGELKATGEDDFLSVVVTNLGGGKTDGVISQRLSVTAEIAPDGTVVDTLRLTRAHQGVPGDAFSGVTNNSYLRFYVPAGSQLVTAEGFELPEHATFGPVETDLGSDDTLAAVEGEHATDPGTGVESWAELGKTVFAHWQVLKPGEERTVVLRYRLQNRISPTTAVWRLYVQKQAGRRADVVEANVSAPPAWRVRERLPAAVGGAPTSFSAALETDAFFGLTFTEANP